MPNQLQWPLSEVGRQQAVESNCPALGFICHVIHVIVGLQVSLDQVHVICHRRVDAFDVVHERELPISP